MSLSQIIVNSSDAACRTYYFAFAFITHINPWLMVAAAVEMTITAKWPKRSHTACSMERARYVMMLLTLILVCLDINHFWTYGVPNGPAATTGCRYVEDFSKNFRDWIWPALENAVLLVLPLLTVGLCLIIAVTSLLQRTPRQEQDLRSHMRKYFLELPVVIDFRMIVLILSFMFLALIIYQAVCDVIMFLFTRGFLQQEDCESDFEFAMTLQLFQTLDMVFRFLFYGGKIYLYVGLSSAFRKRLALGFRSAWNRLVRLVQFCRCVCLGGTPRWTPVSRDDELAGKGYGRSQEGSQLMAEPQTTLPSAADDPMFGGARGFDTSENGASGVTQSNHCAGSGSGLAGSDNAQISAADNGPSQTSRSPSRAHKHRTGQNGRNGAAVRPRDNIDSSKPQRCPPMHRTPSDDREKEHILISLNSNKLGPSTNEQRSVSFGDHVV
ncbi:hypothetical protein EGW08_006401 [Elysia chlorotica]|uniref:G-protein coupled receptors family 1 profile domain-containing protein n=1 Tax=Elysia chlorotica TaxID=188477 RepID=A0A433TWB4_ELYCH|nr:hypothetical protein EGW08_006401 [Elysia chlorotica]